MQEQESISQQSPSPSNSDLNSLASDEEDEETKLIMNGKVPSEVTAKSNGKKEQDFIEDMHLKLEKQIQRMRTAPPAPHSSFC
jgi:hypothetical protein